ncbi:MAG: hypothetical protein OEY31_07595 [Candidatus Bathyarchaeota archaeon]|nr:hypothetical protein [Candidatus Bathyarchaeota archaeon]
MIEFQMLPVFALFIVNALIGSVGFIYFYSITDKKQIIRHLILAVIAAYVYFLLHTDYNFPNAVMTIIVGWFAPDFIQSIMEKYRKVKEGKDEAKKNA